MSKSTTAAGAALMRVLVACEESQRVCQAFRDAGHEAFSCDILPTRGAHPEWHIQDDIRNIYWNHHFLTQNGDLMWTPGWNMMIAFPPCTYLCNSGVSWLYKDKTRTAKMFDAATFFKELWAAPIEKICIENPIPHNYWNPPKYSQIIHPWQFGHMEQKPTCLWLKNLQLLKETNNVRDEMKKLPANQRQRIHHMPPSETRSRDRAVTFQGIADAMSAQWGGA